MANTVIKLKSSGVTGNVPNNLEPGELAINYVDGKLFYGNTSCNAILFDVNNPAGLEGELQFNNSGEFGSSANLKFDNTTKTLNVKNVFANGNVVTNNLVVTSETNLGNVSNVTITGGSANQFLITDGLGNLSFGVGTMGAQGAAGAQGAVGAQGAQGAQGSVGAQGAQGIAGAQGVQGATGQAAPWEVFTANTTAVSGQQLIANTYGGTFTITLPATPSIGNVVRITDGYDWSINNLVIARNGSTIEGTTSDVIVDVKGTTVEFVYDNVTWQVVSTIGPMGNTGPQGIQGTIGPQGFQGVAGAQGAVGAQGDVGAQGVQGAVGAQGVQGATGAQGAIGAQGVQGATGAQGAQGPQGSTPTIGGSNTQIQFNNAGSLGASDNLVWNGTGLGIGKNNPVYPLDVVGYMRGTANNASVGNASSMQFIQNGSGDAAISFLIGATTEWLAGVDNSDSDSFKISNITGGGDFTATGVTLTTAGNLGLGVTPSAWRTANSEKVLQIDTASLYCNAANDVYLNRNWFLNTSAQTVYLESSWATSYGQVDGKHIWYNSGATEGTAGAQFTFTQAMTLDASGQRMLGITTPYGIETVSKTVDNGVAVATNISAFSGAISVIHNQDNPGTGNKTGLFFAHAGSPGLLSGIASTKLSGTWQTTLDFYVNNITGVNVGDIQLAARIDSSGNLGIGTSSPGSKLEVSGGTASVVNTNGRVLIQDGNTSGGAKIGVRGATATSDGYLAFEGYSLEYGRFDASGKLGIGTSSPAQTLHVKTSTSATPITLGVLSNATGLPALSFNGAYASTTMAGIYGNGATASSLYYEVPSGQSHFFGIADVTKMALDSSGNLGIGETTPTAKLHIGVASAAVNGTKGVRITNPAGTIVMLECGSGGDSFVGTESGSNFNIRTNNGINATFLTTGNVGFGETNPTQRIHFKGSSTTYALAETTGSGTSSGFRMKAGANTDYTLFTTEGGNQFAIYNNVTSTQPLTILSNGNIGIGTSSPTTLFHVAGTTNQASSMSSTSGTDAAIAANLSEIRQCSFNVDNSTNFVISNIVTTSTGWRAVFRGTWSNNYEGAGLTPPPPYVEVNAANPSIIVGSRTLTVSRNGSGYLIVNSADSYRIAFSGVVEIHQNPQNGQSNRSMQLLGGITFPATQSASGNANTLDDYEEGTWTATLVSSGGGAVTISSVAKYTKVGNQVLVTVEGYNISISSLSAGSLTITGLPFTCNADSPAVAYFDIAGAVSAAQGAVVLYASNSTTMSVYLSQSTSSTITQLVKSDLNSSLSIRFNGSYLV